MFWQYWLTENVPDVVKMDYIMGYRIWRWPFLYFNFGHRMILISYNATSVKIVKNAHKSSWKNTEVHKTQKVLRDTQGMRRKRLNVKNGVATMEIQRKNL